MDTKRCSRCHLEKPTLDFSRDVCKKDGLNHSCRVCHREWTRAHYRKKREYYVAKAKKACLAARERVSLLKQGPCVDCGGKFNPWQMDFDHVRGEKEFNVSEGAVSYSSSAVRTEIEKCDLVCANCHRDRTYKRTHHM